MSATARKRSFVRFQDLPAKPDVGVCLRCELCEETYSACAGDYFLQAPSDVCECAMCDEPLKLVRKVTRELTYALANYIRSHGHPCRVLPDGRIKAACLVGRFWAISEMPADHARVMQWLGY
jgi:hypothetical protein